MVFPGRFSSGCLRCRQRKVKCDEGKPTCRRCYNYGKPCLGYTDEFHFRHSAPKGRSQSTSSNTSRASKAPSIASASTASPPQDEKPPEKEPPKPKTRPLEAPIRRRSVAMVRHPTQSYDNMSLCYFVRRFVSPDDDDGFPGHFSFLPSLFDHYKDGLVETATLSVAQLAAYNHLGNEELRTRSLRNYGRVIKGLQQTIQSDDQAMDDKVIATILLLCTYKDFSGEGLGDPNEHASGLFYLLEKRGPSQIGTRRGAELFLLALLRLQIYSFLHGDDAYTDPGAIATVIGIFDPLLRALSMMGRTLSLRHRLCRLMQLETYQPQGASPSTASQSSTGTEDERILIQECFDMLDAFGSWDIEAAEYWQLTFEGRGVPTTLGEMSAGKMHYDAETACIIILVRSARLILLQTMLLYQTTLLPTEDDDGYSYNSWAETVPFLESDVRKTVDDMLAAVPYALGDIDPSGMPATMLHDGAAAIIIVHSIRLVTHCVYTTPEQTERAARILARLNSAIGIRSAVGFVPGGDNYGVQPFQALSPLALSKKRREHIAAGLDEVDFEVRKDIVSPDFPPTAVPTSLNIITDTEFVKPSFQDSHEGNPYIYPSPASSIGAPGTNPFVDPRVVAVDRLMAQSQLEDMYKHVLEHEDAKKRGVVYDVPLPPTAHHQPRPSASASVLSLKSSTSSPSKKERSKPATLNLSASREEKSQSRTSSFLSALRSPKKKQMKGMSISSPLMTPQSGEFPRYEGQEMSAIPPRHYAPAAPPPVPTNQVPYGSPALPPKTHASLPTPDISPESVLSIDERIGSQLPYPGHARTVSHAPSERDPESATSEHSQVPLVGLPSSPKPGSRFPSLPASPKPGQTFHRANAPSAVRTGGSLPLRAYEPAMVSPNTIAQTTKQTVFERKGPLSPSGAMTPHTAGAVPYSPYQPFTPCMPVTPSLVTREDRKRMKRMVPKTPTLEMVQSSDDVW